jgi:hypothetical protein
MRVGRGWLCMVTVVAVAGLGFAVDARATTLVVDDDNHECPSALYHTINSALAIANPGDDIAVCLGTYAEQIVLTSSVPIRGLPVLLARPVIAPTTTPATRPTLNGKNPVTAAIIIDAARVRLENLDIDMTGHDTVGCSPIVAGIYLRNSSGSVVNVSVHGPQIPGRLDCDSGVGVLIDSGQSGFDSLGRPIVGRAVVSVRTGAFDGFQKAGIAVVGSASILRLQNIAATGLGMAQPLLVQNAVQVSEGARAKARNLNISQIGTLVPGKLATGVLMIADRSRVRAATLTDVQVGGFFVGDRNAILKSQLVRLSSDGLIVFGDGNRVRNSDLTDVDMTIGVDSIFLSGDQNVIAGVRVSNTPLGLWNYSGMGNVVDQITFEQNVLLRYRQGDVRAISADSAVPFTSSCASDVECDDGNACDGVEHCVAGTCGTGTALVCDDTNECTTDTCDPSLGCESVAVTDGTACTGGTCTGGLCM